MPSLLFVWQIPLIRVKLMDVPIYGRSPRNSRWRPESFNDIYHLVSRFYFSWLRLDRPTGRPTGRPTAQLPVHQPWPFFSRTSLRISLLFFIPPYLFLSLSLSLSLSLCLLLSFILSLFLCFSLLFFVSPLFSLSFFSFSPFFLLIFLVSLSLSLSPCFSLLFFSINLFFLFSFLFFIFVLSLSLSLSLSSFFASFPYLSFLFFFFHIFFLFLFLLFLSLSLYFFFLSLHLYFLCVSTTFLSFVFFLSFSLKIWVQSQIASYQRLKKWYLIPPCLTLSNVRYVSRVKWSNPGKGVAPSPTLWGSSYWKGSLLVILD